MAAIHVLGASRTLPFHSIGGMQAISWDIFRMLAQQGHRVTVLTTAIPGRDGPFEADGVRVEPVASAPAERYSAAWWRDSDAAALRIHASQPVHAVLSVSAAAAEMRRFRAAVPLAPFVFQAHGTSWGEFLSKWRSGEPIKWLKSLKNLYWTFKDARIYRRFDHIALCGDVLAQQFEQWPMPWVKGDVPASLIRNGVDTHRFRPDAQAAALTRQRFGIPADAPLVVFASRLHAQKGGRQMVQAFDWLAASAPQPHLLMVGGGDQEEALRAQAAATACAGRIHFAGAVDRADMPGLLAAGQVFAFPSLAQEGLPMSVLEALACGMPAVASQSMEPVFLPALGLRFFEPQDPAAFAAALKAALADNPPSAPPRSRLTPDYVLSECAQAYARLLTQRKC
jgi:glycosyltransferase involved in cell wall biosynthesis